MMLLYLFHKIHVLVEKYILDKVVDSKLVESQIVVDYMVDRMVVNKFDIDLVFVMNYMFDCIDIVVEMG